MKVQPKKETILPHTLPSQPTNHPANQPASQPTYRPNPWGTKEEETPINGAGKSSRAAAAAVQSSKPKAIIIKTELPRRGCDRVEAVVAGVAVKPR
jgi:hypothetical protein